ncbi:MAG: hypothetical protein VB878_13550 [Pirellulaceae bacterium]
MNINLSKLPSSLLSAMLVFSFSLSIHGQQPRIGGEARLESWVQHREMAENSRFKQLAWQTLGPKFAGGRIESIDASRGDLSTLYVGVGAGGVWKTVNGGLTWKPIFQHESTFAVGDITVAPSDPDTIWVGTGECHLSGSSFAGTGVFKSTDAGKNWTNMGLHESAHIGKVVIDPADPNVVYIAAMGRMSVGGQRGIYKTTDGGKSFKRVLSKGDRVAFVDLVLDPTDSNRLYATSWDRSNGPESGVYRSDDQGEHWKRLAGGLLDQEVDRIAIDASTSQPGVIYALMADRSSPQLARRGNASILFRSNDYGETWNRTHVGYVPTYIGWDFCDLRVAPDDADHVYVGGLRLIISRDGGKTFEGEGGFAINKSDASVFRLHPHTGIGMHLDVHDIWIDPEHPERVLLGNDGGVYLSWDRAQTWLHLNNLPIAEFYRIYLDDQKPFQIWGGTQDNASFVGPASARFTSGGVDRWQQVFLDPWSGGDGFSTFPDPNDPAIVYYTQQNGDLKRGRLRAGARLPHRRSRRIRPRAQEGKPELRFAWDTPFFASSHPGDTVLYCAAQRVLRSNDRGDSWQAISPDFGRGGLLALAESPLIPERLVAGGGRGRVQLTSDGGKTWKPAGSGLPPKTIRDVVLSVHDSDRIYVVLSGKSDHDSASYVYLSVDFGESWKSLAGNLPPESANALAEDPKTKDLIFVGTDLGIYASTTGGAKWESLCRTLPTATTFDLAVHGRDGKLVAATHGLSLFLLDIEPIRQSVKPTDDGLQE